METHSNALIDTLYYSPSASSPLPTIFKTDDFLLRRVHPNHISTDRLHALFHNVIDADEVFRYCSWSQHHAESDTQAYLENRIKDWATHDRFEYVIQHPETDEYMGTTYLSMTDTMQSGTFGLWLQKPYWGKGISGKRADVLLHAAFELLGVDYIDVGCLAPNKHSLKAIKKYVSRYNGAYYGSPPVPTTQYHHTEEETLPHHEFAITHEQYQSGDSGITCMVPGVQWDDIPL